MVRVATTKAHWKVNDLYLGTRQTGYHARPETGWTGRWHLYRPDGTMSYAAKREHIRDIGIIEATTPTNEETQK